MANRETFAILQRARQLFAFRSQVYQGAGFTLVGSLVTLAYDRQAHRSVRVGHGLEGCPTAFHAGYIF